jgi:hypothetical protein
MSYEEDRYQAAKKKIEAKKGFYIHFGIYIACAVFFLLMNMITSPDEIWFVYPLLPWGLAIAIHYITVFGLFGTKILTHEWEEREIRKEMERMDDPGDYDRDTLPPARGDPDELDLREIEKRPKWKDKDFV